MWCVCVVVVVVVVVGGGGMHESKIGDGVQLILGGCRKFWGLFFFSSAICGLNGTKIPKSFREHKNKRPLVCRWKGRRRVIGIKKRKNMVRIDADNEIDRDKSEKKIVCFTSSIVKQNATYDGGAW
jgi:hypothetical protein